MNGISNPGNHRVMQKALIYFSMISFLLLSAGAKADIYTTGVAFNFTGNSGGVSAWTQPNLGGDGAIVSLAINDSLQLKPTAYSVGIGHVWYSVTPGTAIDPAFAASAPAFVNAFTGYLGGTIELGPGYTFLLGFWLDANGNGTPGLGDRFGWASFTYNQSTLHFNSSAIESNGIGIIAGTTTEVPEPSTLCLIFLGLAAVPYLLLRRRRPQRV